MTDASIALQKENSRPALAAGADSLLLPLGILLLAVAARWAWISAMPLSPDEGYSAYVIQSARGLMQELQSDTNPPLYFVLLKAWTALFGDSLLAMRSLSALFGVGMAALVGWLAYLCGGSRRTIYWAMGLAALSPLQIYYAQEARGYTLNTLLMTLGLASFVWALKTGRAAAWELHAGAVALGAYAHNLFVPLAAGYWLAAVLMRVKRKQFAGLAMAHAAAAVAAIPAAWLTMTQVKGSGGLAWIAPFWQKTPPALAIPKSVQVLGFGGEMPPYLVIQSLPAGMTVVAVLLTVAALVAAFWPRGAEPSAKSRAVLPFGSYGWALLSFTLWPLVFVWVYSIVKTPIYLVGRYDLFAQPALLCLLAAGLARMQEWRSLAYVMKWALPALVMVVMGWGIAGRWMMSDRIVPISRLRVEYLSNAAQPDDVLICTGLETSQALYYLRGHNMRQQVMTFPEDGMSHIGWLAKDEDLLSKAADWPAAAQSLFASQEQQGRQRAWLLLDYVASFSPGTPRQRLSKLLVATAQARGWTLIHTDAEHREMEENLSMVGFQRGHAGP